MSCQSLRRNHDETVRENCKMAPLTVAVIGAGPGGLLAALSLRKAGHKVDVCFHHMASLFSSSGLSRKAMNL
jgi:NADPH-dependent 2,4-dienoyl-CoA reductase/sulfur reductase-like enzyme